MIMEEIKLNERMMTIATTTPFYNKNQENEMITYEEFLLATTITTIP